METDPPDCFMITRTIAPVLAFVAHLLITRKLFVAQQEAATP